MRKMLIALFAAWTSVAMAAGTVVVKSVEAHQRYPWNGLVDIVVTIECQANDIGNVVHSFVATNSATHTAVPVTSITQKGSDEGSGTMWTRRFLWNAANDVGAVKIDDLALTVGATIPLGGVQLWENGPYWAECNVGAMKPEEYGYYFWWGNTEGYKLNASNNGLISVKDGSSFAFDPSNCPTFEKSNSQLQSSGYIDATGNLVAAHDAATAHLGEPWRMPTDVECAALVNNCDKQWTTRGGVYGRLVTGRGAYASKSIFLPAADMYAHSGIDATISLYGFYWSSSPNSGESEYACYIYFHSSYFSWDCYGARCCVLPVRPLRGFANNNDTVLAGTGAITHMKLDCRTGERSCTEGAETLYYDVGWYENATRVQVYVGSLIIADGVNGSVVWQPDTNSAHELKLVAYSVGGATVGQMSVTRSYSHVEVVTKMAKAATCTEAGWTKGSYCNRCNAVLATSKTIAALGHVELITTAAKPATCTKVGCTKGSSCSRCNAVLATSTTLPMLGHSEVVTTVAREPRCTETGCTKGSYCSRCNAVLATSAILPVLGHVEHVATAAKAATCTEAGCTKGSYCGRCNAVLATSMVLSALGHREVVTTVAKESTCTETGCTKGSYCSRCNAVLATSTVLPALGHSEIVIQRKEPTCTSAGNTQGLKCSRCNVVLSASQTIAALGHVECVTIDPCEATCTKAGRTKGSYCTRCNAVLSTSSAIEALGHDERVIVEAKSPTCIEAGCTKGSCCQRCGIVLVSSEEIPALGHLPVVTKQAVKPTTVAAGRTEEIACSRCNAVLQASEVIEAIAYVRDVQARQLWPHKKVGVEFTVTKDVQSVTNENAKLVLQCEIGGEIIPAEKIYGDMTLTPGRHHVIWDVEDQGVSVSTTSAKFRIGVSGAEEPDVGLYTDALYCVIDLSGGATATSYPITYLSGVPSGGWSDEYKTSKLVLRYIEPGTFMMGSPEGETGRSSDEVQHEVTLTQGFWIGVFEVTQRQYELVMGENGSYFNNASCYASRPAERVSYNEIRGNSAGYQWSHPPFNADSDSFIGRIRKKTGIPGFDLPSEAQWEYACRAGTTTPYNSGGLSRWSENSGLNKYTKSSDCSVATAKVGSFSPNGWGLYDMHGNVWEWCYDRYGTYGTTSTDPIVDSSSSYHVARGGAWNCTDVACRSARRNSSFARMREEKDTGFRLSCWSGLVR